MPINHIFFNDKIINYINKLDIDEKEKKYRITNLNKALEEIKKENSTSLNRYYQLVHEIKTYKYLSSNFKVTLSKDSIGQSGCDMFLDNNIQVECVMVTTGTKEEFISKFNKVNIPYSLDGRIIDYSNKEELILERISSSIASKNNKLMHDINKGCVSNSKPYILFISTGYLSYEYLISEDGFEFNKLLYGLDKEKLVYDEKSKNLYYAGYTIRDSFKKSNNANLNCRLFFDIDYSCISAIILSNATFIDFYDKNNTWMFINPNAKNKIKNISRFKNTLIYYLGETGTLKTIIY